MACLGHMVEFQNPSDLQNNPVDTGHYCTCICFKHGRAHRCWIIDKAGRPENCCQNV